MGANSQFRIMGGAIGLSIINTVMHSFLRSHLSSILTLPQLESVLGSAQAIAALPTNKYEQVVLEFSEGYNIQMKIMSGMAAIQLLGTGIMWQKNQIRV